MTNPAGGLPPIPSPWQIPVGSGQALPPITGQRGGSGSPILGIISILCAAIACLAGASLLILSTWVLGNPVGTDPVWILFLVGTCAGILAIATGIAAISTGSGRVLGIFGTWLALAAGSLPPIALFVTLVITIRGSRL
jgi:hypothetical protein